MGTSDPRPSDEVARLLAELESAADDRELIERFDLIIYGEGRDLKLLTEPLEAAYCNGYVDRVDAARRHRLDDLVAAIEADHEQRREAIAKRIADALGVRRNGPG